jgi:hypothetical protein
MKNRVTVLIKYLGGNDGGGEREMQSVDGSDYGQCYTGHILYIISIGSEFLYLCIKISRFMHSVVSRVPF